MANETKQQEGEKKAPSQVRTIREAIAQRIAESGPHVRDGVLNVLTEKEIRRRSDAILKGLEMEDQHSKEIRKLEKPDLVTYDANGNETSANFSKTRVEDLKKTREKRDKMHRALENALAMEEPNFQKLFELVGGKGSEQASDAPAE